MSNVLLVISFLSFAVFGLFLLVAIASALMRGGKAKKRLKLSGIAFLVCLLSFVGFGMTEKTTEEAAAETEQTETSAIEVDKFADTLQEEMAANFSGTSWYGHIQSFEVVSRQKGYDVKIKTELFPKESNKEVAQNIATAVFGLFNTNDSTNYVERVSIYGQNDNLIFWVDNPIEQ